MTNKNTIFLKGLTILLVFLNLNFSFANNNPYLNQVDNNVTVKIDVIINQLKNKKYFMSYSNYTGYINNFIEKLDNLKNKYKNNNKILSVINYIVFDLEQLKQSSSNTAYSDIPSSSTNTFTPTNSGTIISNSNSSSTNSNNQVSNYSYYLNPKHKLPIYINKNRNDGNSNYLNFMYNPKKGSTYKIEEEREIDVILKNVKNSDVLYIDIYNHLNNTIEYTSKSSYKVSDLKVDPKFVCHSNSSGHQDCIYTKMKLPKSEYNYHNGYKKPGTSLQISINKTNDVKNKMIITLEEKHPNKNIIWTPNRNQSKGYNYLTSTLPEKTYNEYNDVFFSKSEWDKLSNSQKKKVLYWDILNRFYNLEFLT